MWHKEMKATGAFGLISSLLVLVVFVVLQWLGVPAGRWLDWVIGIASFWWLLALVTLPWTMHFHAREVLAQGERSRERGLSVEPEQMAWASKLAKVSLFIAIALHLGSAAAFGALAHFGVTPMGYLCSALALAMTTLRPGLRALEYVQRRLTTIRQDVITPRRDAARLYESVDRLMHRVDEQRSELRQLRLHLNKSEEARHALAQALTTLAEERERGDRLLAAKIDETVQTLSDDVRFIEHVRELIRFVRAA